MKKEIVSRMIEISKVVGNEIFIQILFPLYKKLANDPIWGVRKAAVEVMPQIAHLCSLEVKDKVLVEMFKKFV